MIHMADRDEVILNVEEELKTINDNINELIKLVHQQANLRFYLLVYNLVKRTGKVGPKDIAECANIDRTSVYNMIDRFEKYLDEKQT